MSTGASSAGWAVELSVNIDHVATLRNARGGVEPEPAWAAAVCEQAGADGITVHLREDRRHIRDRDVRLLREVVQTRFNLEMAAAPDVVELALEVRPDMVMLVPERRAELTTEGGLDVVGRRSELAGPVRRILDAGLAVSMFIDAQADQILASHDLGASVCEIHTGPYAQAWWSRDRAAVSRELGLVAQAGERVLSLGMQWNAGHGLTAGNVGPVAGLAGVRELHIGHSIVSRSVFLGLAGAVQEMKQAIQAGQALGLASRTAGRRV